MVLDAVQVVLPLMVPHARLARTGNTLAVVHAPRHHLPQ